MKVIALFRSILSCKGIVCLDSRLRGNDKRDRGDNKRDSKDDKEVGMTKETTAEITEEATPILKKQGNVKEALATPNTVISAKAEIQEI